MDKTDWKTPIAWLGLALVLISIIIPIDVTINGITNFVKLGRPDWGMETLKYLIALPIGSLGAILAIVFSLIVKPKFLWGSMIIVGIVYVLPFVLALFDEIQELKYRPIERVWGDFAMVFLFSLPGFVCIVGGILVRRLRRKSEAAA